MSSLKIQTNFNIELEFEAPEFHRRMFAAILDMLLLFFYLRIDIAFLSAVFGDGYLSRDDSYNLHWTFLITLLPIFLYQLICEITMNGQSIGKKLMRIQVINETGGRPSISQYLIRWLIRTSDYTLLYILIIVIFSGAAAAIGIIIAVLAPLLLLDIILIASTKKNQRLGDILAHTILVKTNTKSNIEDTVFQEVADDYIPRFPQVMQLSDRDLNTVKGILSTSQTKGDFDLASRAAEKIKGHLKIETSLSPFEFLEILLKDYNYLSTK